MPFIGNQPTAVPLTSADISDGIITSAKLDSAVATISTGTIISYSNGTLLAGYLDCDGTAVSRTTYANLFAVVGTTYGSGDGSTTFNLPDLQDNHPIGVSGTKALGTKAGSNTITLATTNLASHNHLHNDYLGKSAGNGTAGSIDTQYVAGASNSGGVVTASTAHLTGNGTAINTFPPYIALKFMIKT